MNFSLPENFSADILLPQESQPSADAATIIQNALDAPLNNYILPAPVPGDKVVIAVNDKTRPVPHNLLLPPLMEKLAQVGWQDKDITFLIATGTHTPTPPEEFHLTLPDWVIQRYTIQSHNCDQTEQLVYVGETSRKTPVWINKTYYNASLKISVGNIEPHHFAGFSGSAKSVSIGLTGRTTINHNHKHLADPLAKIGNFETNPLRQDIEEIGDLVGLDFVLNIIMNPAKQILTCLAGNPKNVILAGTTIARKYFETPVDGNYDLVIVSPGGHPKDINLYQAQKAVTNAAAITRDGGIVILVAACPDGPGSQGYVDFMQQVTSMDEVYQRFSETEFQVGPHKALLIARDARRVNLWIFSDMKPSTVQSLLLKPVDNLQNSIDTAIKILPPHSKIAVMPAGVTTMPSFSQKE